MSLTKKIDFALILKVTNANPNGDPLNGNRPRADFQGFGEMTDVCLKRKIRDRLQDSGESIFVQSDEKKTDGMTSLASRARSNDKIKIKNKDGQEIEIAGILMNMILTPGHTEGSCCYYLPNHGLLFSGDTLFQASRGRTDFPGGSDSQIINSIKTKLLVLPDETVVLPGHMDSTKIEFEKGFYR